MGRELCLFTSIDASRAPRSQRDAFVATCVQRAAPFADPDFNLAWADDGTASIWYWSRSRVAELAAEELGRSKRFVAEALYYGAPRSDDVCLFQLSNGVEGRVWKNGKVDASRWWPAVPTPEQWQSFVRSTGRIESTSATPPSSTPAELTQTAWSKKAFQSGKVQFSGLHQYFPQLLLVVLGLFTVVTAAQLGSIVRAQVDIFRGEAAAAALDAPLKSILAAREAADAANTEISQLLSLHGLRPTTSLMAELTRLMPASEWQLKKWVQPTPDTLEVTFVAPGSNPEALVSSWEASAMFGDVSTELGRDNELIIKARVISSMDQGTGGSK